MQFSHPIFLWALTGLSIPLAIHLLSRKEGKVIRMGSLRHLRETSTQQFKGIKLNETLLLVLRSLLIILFVLLISGLHWKDDGKKWLLVEKGLEQNPMVTTIEDSLKSQGFEWHWLQKGFPLKKINSEITTSNNWDIINLVQQQDLQQAIVISASRAENFKGMRQAVNQNIRWVTLPNEPVDFIAQAIQQTPKQVLIRKGHSSADYTTFETLVSTSPLPDSIPATGINHLMVTIVPDPTFEQEKLVIKAALSAISKTLPITISILESTPEKSASLTTDWIIWLSDKNTLTNDSINLIEYRPQPSNKFLEKIDKNKWSINRKLNVDNAREGNLTLQLASLLIDEKEKWDRVSVNDKRILPDSILLKGTTSSSYKPTSTIFLGHNQNLLIILLLALCVERFVSYKRNQ